MRTIGIEQGGGNNYPFVDPSFDIKGVVADISVGTTQPVQSVKLYYICITRSSVEICLVNEDNTILFDSRTTPYSRKTDSAWGGSYRVVYWESPEFQIKLVVWDEDTEKYPKSAVLDLRTVFVKPKHVSSLTVIDKEGVRHKIQGKHVVFQPGYNLDLELTRTDSGVRRRSTLELKSEAGSGMGRMPADEDIEENRVLRTINGQGTEDGAFLIKPEDGYGLETDESCSKLYIYNTDTPCCSCSDADDMRSYIDEVAAMYWKLSTALDDIKERHEDNIKQWKLHPPVHENIRRDPMLFQAVSDDCRNIVARLDLTNRSAAPCDISMTISASIQLHFLDIIVTYPTVATIPVEYLRGNEVVTTNKKVWLMKTIHSPHVPYAQSFTRTDAGLMPGQTASVLIYAEIPEYTKVSTLTMNGSAVLGSNTYTSSEVLDMYCQVTDVQDITPFEKTNENYKDRILALNQEVWDIRKEMWEAKTGSTAEECEEDPPSSSSNLSITPGTDNSTSGWTRYAR